MQEDKSTKVCRKGGWIWRNLGLLLIIIVQTAVYLLAGASKAYLHMDEAFSLGLTHFEVIDPASQPDFYDHWHTNEYFEDYLAVRENEVGNFVPVIENQKNDVHPPLYYLLLRLGQNLVPGRYSKWPGILLNIIIAVGNTILIYAILLKLLKREQRAKEKSLVMTAVVALTLATISSVVYIRMYQLLTFWVLLTTWLHLYLYEKRKLEPKLLIGIGLTAVAGVLTQYYYLFFLLPIWLVMVVRYVKEKQWKTLQLYTGTLMVAGGVALLIWPQMINHLLFSNRGQGVLESLLNVPKWLGQIWEYGLIIDYYDFHRVLIGLLAIAAAVILVRCLHVEKNTIKSDQQSSWQLSFGWKLKINQKKGREQQWQLIIWPTLVYFLIVAIVSPYIELRYIMPICGLVMIIVMWWIYKTLGNFLKERTRNGVMAGMLALMMVAAPVQLGVGGMRVELLYRDKEPLMRELKENHEIPTVYFLTTENNRFLDNLLPFVVMDQSYLALDWPFARKGTQAEQSEGLAKDVQKILNGKDLSRGLYIWVGDQYNQQAVLDVVQKVTDLRELRHVRGVNTCEIYLLK